MSWVIFIAVFMLDGSVEYGQIPIGMITGENSLASCQQFKTEFEHANPLPIDGVDHYRVGCIQE